MYSKIMPVLRLCNSILRFKLKKIIKNRQYEYSQEAQSYVKKIKENGFVMIENFYSIRECQELRLKIDSYIDKKDKEGLLWQDKDDKSDKRIFGAEHLSQIIMDYHKNEFIRSIAENYFRGQMTCVTTLASRLDEQEGNKGSGGGWHYDARNFEFKSFIYLSDVDIDNGPFQIIKKSHHFRETIKHLFLTKNDGINTRFSSRQVSKVIEKDPELYQAIIAPAGTLILVDTSAMHAGMPIRKGSRYSLFNYFYPFYDDVQKRLEQYNVKE